MTFYAKFVESCSKFTARFGAVQTISDGGYERGYERGYAEGEAAGHEAGYAEGEAAGHEAGYAEGLAAREYETWTITLIDGTTVEKEVALL